MSRTFIAILRPSPKKKKKKKKEKGKSFYVPLHTSADCLSTAWDDVSPISPVELSCWVDWKSRFNSHCDKNLDVAESETCWAGAMWSRRESVAFSERRTAGRRAAPQPSPPSPPSWELCRGILCARLQGEEHKTQVPKAIIKLPKPFLLLFNLFVANPANNTWGY